MKERALLVGGNLAIFSEEGEGTTVELTMGGR
jgi:signal transduction histidine kinase